MDIDFDPAKRAATLARRGLDFADAALVFAEETIDFEDVRFAYPERRFVTVGFLKLRMVVVVWTPTATGRRIISMRKANEREQKAYR
jgi:uncharacterized DUF497 family protein